MRGGPAGDLYVVVRVEPHELFVREGADLHLEQEISAFVAALGAELEVPTLDGTETRQGSGGRAARRHRGAEGQGSAASAALRQRRPGGAPEGDGAPQADRQAARAAAALVEGEDQRPGVFRKVRDLIEGSG